MQPIQWLAKSIGKVGGWIHGMSAVMVCSRARIMEHLVEVRSSAFHYSRAYIHVHAQPTVDLRDSVTDSTYKIINFLYLFH